MNVILILPIFGLIIWFWVLVFKLLVRANRVLQIYIDPMNIFI